MIVCTVLAGVIIIVLYLNHRIKKTNYYMNLFEDINKYQDMGDQLEYANLGSTFSNYAFDYSDLGLNGFNFAINGQNLEYDYKILQHYSNRIKEGAKIFIVCADLELVYNTTKEYYRNVRVYKYYKNVLGYKEVPFFLKYYLAYILLPIIKIGSIKYLIHDCKPYNKKAHEKNLMTEGEADKDALRRIQGWETLFNIQDWQKQDLSISYSCEIRENIGFLKSIIKFCKEKGWKPYIVVPPVSSILNKYLSSNFVEMNLLRYLRNLCDVQQIELLDYSRDDEFQALELYINSACLNKIGRKKFLERLLKDISDSVCQKYE